MYITRITCNTTFILSYLGNDALYYKNAVNGDSEYSDWWQHYKENPSDFSYKTVADGLEMIKNERAVIHIVDNMLNGYFTNNPYHVQDIKVMNVFVSDMSLGYGISL